jgi:DNA-binding Lrp family transcriptional regulator
MRLAIDRNDQMFLDRLHKMCGGTIQEICDAIGVTATAIRQRLARLEGQLVEVARITFTESVTRGCGTSVKIIVNLHLCSGGLSIRSPTRLRRPRL